MLRQGKYIGDTEKWRSVQLYYLSPNDSVALSKEELPASPYGVLLDSFFDIPEHKLTGLLLLLQSAGAEWFCGVGQQRERLHDLWDDTLYENSDVPDSTKSYLMSISESSLSSGLEAFDLTAVNKDSDSYLDRCIVLANQPNKLKKHVKWKDE